MNGCGREMYDKKYTIMSGYKKLYKGTIGEDSKSYNMLWKLKVWDMFSKWFGEVFWNIWKQRIYVGYVLTLLMTFITKF